MEADTIYPSSDTYITEHAGLGGPNSTHGNDAFLEAIRASHPFQTFPLIKFDLSAYAGKTVTGPATLGLYLDPATPFLSSTPRIESVSEVLIPWNAATVTYNNFSPAGPGVHPGSDVGPALDTEMIVYNSTTPGNPTGPRYVTWTISASVLQRWIDQPASNDGLLIFPDNPDNFDLIFDSSRNTNPPVLTFQVEGAAAPEPATATLLGLGAVCTLGYGWRRRRQAESAKVTA